MSRIAGGLVGLLLLGAAGACGGSADGPVVTRTASSSPQPSVPEDQAPPPPSAQGLGVPLPESEVIYYFYHEPEQPWRRIPSIVAVAADDDPRADMLDEAIAFWNEQLEANGTEFRLSTASRSTNIVPADAIVNLCANFADEEAFATIVRGQTADIVVVMSDVEMAFSCSTPLLHPLRTRSVVVIRDSSLPPMNIPAVVRQVIAHELGHSLGLGHNNDPTTLMCGRPADCKPERLQFGSQRFLSLTAEEIEFLQTIYPDDWRPLD